MTSCRQSNSPVDADGADTIAPEPVKLLPPVDHLDSSQEKDIIIREKLASPETNAAVLSPRDATKEEIETLHHVVGKIPLTAWLVAFTGAASQFAYYGTTIPWQNYVQNPGGNPLVPGALGLGQAKATSINFAFLFFTYVTPMPFAIVSDAWIGRYRTMLVGVGLILAGCVVLFVTSLPVCLERGAGVGGLVVAMLLIGLGRGAQKAVLYPLIGDQVPERNPQLIQTKTGELVIDDRKLAIQYIFNVYYWMVNIAGLSSLATTFMEKYIGFWAAYLLPLCFLCTGIIPLITWHKLLVKLHPTGNVLPQAIKVFLIACRSGFRLSAAMPGEQRARRNRSVPWTAGFVHELQRGLQSCRVVIGFVVFYLCYNQVVNNVISQAGQMELGGVSNDTIQSLNPIACIILGPIIQNLLFPFLRRRKIPFGPIARITVAFVFTSAAVAYAAGVQQLIYSRSPCYQAPLACPAAHVASNNGEPQGNEISVWVQTPFHFLLGVGEILGLVSLSEYSYAQAPANMKAVVQALQQLTAALASALGAALGPVSRDPYLVIMYACLAATMALSGVIFWAVFWRQDRIYEISGTTREDEHEGDGRADVEASPSTTVQSSTRLTDLDEEEEGVA